MEATVVLEGGPGDEAIAAAECPGLAPAGLVVNDDKAADGANGSGVQS